MPSLDAAAKRKLVTSAVLALYQKFYRSAPDSLAMDPNDDDLDPAPFYELIGAAFKIEDDEDDDDESFGGLGGSLKSTIAYVVKNWQLQNLAAIERLAGAKAKPKAKPKSAKAPKNRPAAKHMR